MKQEAGRFGSEIGFRLGIMAATRQRGSGRGIERSRIDLRIGDDSVCSKGGRANIDIECQESRLALSVASRCTTATHTPTSPGAEISKHGGYGQSLLDPLLLLSSRCALSSVVRRPPPCQVANTPPALLVLLALLAHQTSPVPAKS